MHFPVESVSTADSPVDALDDRGVSRSFVAQVETTRHGQDIVSVIVSIIDGEIAAYTATFEAVGTFLISQTMFTDDSYRRLGLPEACILLVGRLFALIVLSSSNAEAEWLLQSEMRTPPATKAWERLVTRGLARKTGIDRYSLLR